MPLSNYFKDKYVAPEISSFTSASIRDMSAVSAEQNYWLINFILNTGLRVTMNDAARQTFYNFLRRTEAAFLDYEAARQRTLKYLGSPNRDALAEYIVAIGHWEAFLSHAYQACCLLYRGQKSFFERGDGSVLQRLNLLYNRAKHAETAITNQQLPPDGTLPVWLKNDGLHCVESSLTFDEIAELLEELAQCADEMQDPLAMHEKNSSSAITSP
jgi:hypothetical protein